MGKNKRTPTGKIDDARKEADAEWEVEAIIACSTGKEGVKYLVRWKGFDEKHDTYEFEKNLQDAQDALKKFQSSRSTVPRTLLQEKLQPKRSMTLLWRSSDRIVRCLAMPCYT